MLYIFKDYHSIDNSQPIEDLINNWSLEEAKQNETHTELYFSRKFDTCDNEDVPITVLIKSLKTEDS